MLTVSNIDMRLATLLGLAEHMQRAHLFWLGLALECKLTFSLNSILSLAWRNTWILFRYFRSIVCGESRVVSF